MTLYEIGLEYQKSAEPLRARLRELRTALAGASDPEERWRIKQRIKQLTPLLTECNKLARHCMRYYERGYYIGDGAFYSERRPAIKETKPPSLQGTAIHYEKRTDPVTERDSGTVSFREQNIIKLCKRKGGKQVDRIKNILSGT